MKKEQIYHTSQLNMILYPVIRECVSTYNPQSYLEIGVRDGYSLYTVLAVPNNIQRLCLCDTWANEYGGTGRQSHDHITQLLAELDFTFPVTFLDGPSQLLIPTLKTSWNMILIDGDHSEIGCQQDLDNCWPILLDFGIIIVDDLIHRNHSYLLKVVLDFVDQTPDARLVRLEDKQYSGAAVIQKVATTS